MLVFSCNPCHGMYCWARTVSAVSTAHACVRCVYVCSN